MADAKDIIRYLRECYRESGARGGIWNWFGTGIKYRVGIAGEEPLAMDSQAVNTHYLRQTTAFIAAKTAEVSRKEHDLVYATLFVVGWVERYEGKPEAVCAPLFVYPAAIDTSDYEQGGALTIDHERRQTNYPLLEGIGGLDLAQEIERNIDQTAIGEACLGELRASLKVAHRNFDLNALLKYPQLVSQVKLKQAFERVKRRKTNKLRLVAASAIGLVRKSVEMRGVLNELDEMAHPDAHLSAPVRALLGEETDPYDAVLRGRVPAVLSKAQQDVIEKCRDHSLVLAIGPPGTGKSFTIAAMAIEVAGRGFGTLIASKMNHAVDVVGDKIDKTLGIDGLVVRGGSKHYLRDLKEHVSNLLSGVLTPQAPCIYDEARVSVDLNDKEKAVKKLTKHIEAELKRELKAGKLLAREGDNFITRLRQRWAKKRADDGKPIWVETARLEALIDEVIADTVVEFKMERDYRLATQLKEYRKSFQWFDKALRARTGVKKEEYFGKFRLWDVTRAFAVWLVNLSDIHRVLPNQWNIFEMSIIDEATQCDMASALPILQRGCRALIVGDPKQLRHISFLPKARQEALAKQFGLTEEQRERFNFRDVSLLDLASSQIDDQDQVVFLNEHFRSEPEIIEFSNREFYAGNLQVMTNCRNLNEERPDPLELTAVDGERAANGINKAEVDAIIGTIGGIEAAEADLNAEFVHSIGIVSPFTNQAEAIQKAFLKMPNAASILERHDVLIGTVHSFQGEERDMMLVSLALDDNAPSASYRFLDRRDIFNVMVTRARLRNHVFYSFSPDQVKPDSLLASFMNYAANIPKTPSAAAGDENLCAFADEVAAQLRKVGAIVHIGYPLAGMIVDLVYTLDGETRGVDLIGYPGSFAAAFNLERVLILRRAGLSIVPLPYSAWLVRREECLAWLTMEAS
ncbi:MAG: AAA domain-containing protein [Verrucomicrobiota bacterium]